MPKVTGKFWDRSKAGENRVAPTMLRDGAVNAGNRGNRHFRSPDVPVFAAVN
jgi:hypothetical protein